MAGRIKGIFAPLTTPFVDDEVAFDHLKENMKKYSRTPLAGYFALGSNGEAKSMTETEKLKVLETVIAGKAEQQIVMAGSGYESTKQTIEFSKKVIAAGADFVSIITPSYFKKSLTDDALIGYYTDVAEALTKPVLIYNAPGFTGMAVSAKVIEKIAVHPNIAGMKDTSPADMARFLEVSPDDFDVLSGTVNTLFPAMVMGAKGGVVSLADAFAEPCCDLYDKFVAGDIDGARKMHFKLFALNRSVSGSFGVAGVKYAMELGGYFGGDPRLPLLPLKEENKKAIAKGIAEAGLK